MAFELLSARRHLLGELRLPGGAGDLLGALSRLDGLVKPLDFGIRNGQGLKGRRRLRSPTLRNSFGESNGLWSVALRRVGRGR